MCVPKDRLRVGPTPLGVLVICLVRCLGIAPLGAVTMVGGSSDPSVPLSPVTLQEKAGRPMGPSTLRCEYPWEVVVVFVGYLFWLFRFLSVLCEAVVLSQGSVYVFVPLSPSRPDPCLASICLSPFFSCMVCSSTPCVFSFFFSLSLRHWETQTPFGWFGVPLVFSSSSTRSPTSTRTSCWTPTPRHCPAPVFFLFRRRSLFAGSVFLSFLVWVLVGFSVVGFGRSVFRLFVVVGHGFLHSMYALGQEQCR